MPTPHVVSQSIKILKADISPMPELYGFSWRLDRDPVGIGFDQRVYCLVLFWNWLDAKTFTVKEPRGDI